MLTVGSRKVGHRQRLAAFTGIALLHFTAYFVVVGINARRPRQAFLDVSIAPDAWIPYLGWTWVCYYFAYIYVVFWAAYLFWQLPVGHVRRAVLAYAGTILLGALVQIAVPVVSPWPDTLAGPQHWFHENVPVRPYACLPSMHVALSVLPAGIALTLLSSRWLKATSTVLAALISASTLTLKEHYTVDVAAGLLLGVAAWAYWRRGCSALTHPVRDLAPAGGKLAPVFTVPEPPATPPVPTFDQVRP